MVTKLKNSRKFAIFLMTMILFLSACVMILSYPIYNRNNEIKGKIEAESIMEMTDAFVGGTYYLYNQVYDKMDPVELADHYSLSEFVTLKSYMEYEIFDLDGKPLLKNSKTERVKKLRSNKMYYGLRIEIALDENGLLDYVEVKGSLLEPRVTRDMERKIQDWYSEKTIDNIYSGYEELEEEGELIPKNTINVYGFSESQLKSYLEVATDDYRCANVLSNNRTFLAFQWGIASVVAVLGVLIAGNKNWKLHELKIFRAWYELIVLAGILIVSAKHNYAAYAWRMIKSHRFEILDSIQNLVIWMIAFGVVLWGAICLQEIYELKLSYIKERSLLVSIFRSKKGTFDIEKEKKTKGFGVKDFFKRIWQKIRTWSAKIYDEFMHMDVTEGANKMIIKALVLNFAFLAFITCFWFFGIFALVIYSLILFVILRKYFQDVKKKYELLLESTNLLAEGNLDVPIEGDYGIFNSIKTEIQKIQRGFKKAVDEEVKSERMKTELITNVSHDLKTPLTAIITYVDLLKCEESPEKRKEYLEVLEKKSLRLKVLIEDLFEISKATSKNVTMNFMNVDIVGLLKQVELECDEKIKTSNLEFRWKLPEGKVVMLLDSQKTYRIFENLIVNITKYAMPHSRAYVELIEEENAVVVTMKNVSAEELNFNTEEITDRFVRGDAARNTEGSGLGLAIAKSFTELQYGTLEVTTDADLFKVEIRLPKRMTV